MVMSRKTVGDELEFQLFGGIREAQNALVPGARSLPILWGLTPNGGFIHPQENVLVQAADLLVESGRVYAYGEAIVFEVQRLDGEGFGLTPLRTGASVEVGAEDLLANILVCQLDEKQFPISKWFADVLLRSELLIARLPRIQIYSTRPVVDGDFVLRNPGWHPQSGILIHGPEIEPTDFMPSDSEDPVLDRLPHHLRTLLGGFCFRGDADVANAVAMMLTGLLMNHWIVPGKPIFLLDGNQPGVGKTLLVRVVGVVLDGVDPRLIHFTSDDEELGKRLCAVLREGRQSIVLIDNAKLTGGTSVSSSCIEANSMAPEVSLRILGKSENYSRPNDLLWAITMNDTRTSPDLVSRGVPVQLAYEGQPEDRAFNGPDPIAYAREHRLDILGELAGMILKWNQLGRPAGDRPHRLAAWSRVIGGIITLAGFPEFLANVGTAAATFNSELDELAALAETVIAADTRLMEGDDE